MMCTKTENEGEQEEKIKKVITEFNERFDNKDLPGMLEYFRDDFQLGGVFFLRVLLI